MFRRSRRATTNRSKRKGRILIRIFRIVLASIAVASAAVSIPTVTSMCLVQRFHRQGLLIRGAEGLGTLRLEGIPVNRLAQLRYPKPDVERWWIVPGSRANLPQSGKVRVADYTSNWPYRSVPNSHHILIMLSSRTFQES